VDQRTILCAGAVLGGLAVILGAFGAHGLKDAIPQWVADPAEQAKRLDAWEVAVRYQMYHALALLVIGIVAQRQTSNGLLWSAGLFVFGVLIFSGFLYGYALSGVKILGAIVPLGGTAMIIGWIVFAISAWRLRN